MFIKRDRAELASLLERLAAAITGLVTVVALTAIPASAARSRQYHAVDFGFGGEAQAINDRGAVVGEGILAPGALGFHPFLWENGRLIDLGVLEQGEWEYGRATDVNNRGQVVGFSVVNQNPEQSGQHAILWQHGVLTDLDPLGIDSLATAINNRGQIVGTRYTADGPHAVVWHNGVMTDLGSGYAADINDRGQVIGLNQAGGSGATMWYRGEIHDLGAPPGLEDWRPVAINDGGWIVGSASVDFDERAYLWRSGSFVDLGTLGGSSAFPVDVNNRGQVLGVSGTAEPSGAGHGFLWQNGTMIDLFGRGIPEYPTINAVSNRGQIVGTVDVPDDVHAGIYR
jgi:probable HAF family extracellular repeat protein